MREVFLVGVGATGFGAVPRAGGPLVAEAMRAALADAGVGVGDVSAAAVAGRPVPEAALHELLAGTPRLGHPSTWAGRALQRARHAVASGEHELVLCVGLGSGMVSGHPLRAQAEAAQRYMGRTGATAEHLARITVKNRRLGAVNPRVLTGPGPIDVEMVLAGDVVAWPLRRLMVAGPSTGAAAVVFASEAALAGTTGKALHVRTGVLTASRDPEDAAARAARLAYQEAGLGPEDLDCAELDDRTAATELWGYEALQFVPAGQGRELVDSGFTALGGVLPVNAGGGILSYGDATGASGLAQVCELAWQLRGTAAGRQVHGAATGMALCGHEPRDGEALVSLLLLQHRL